MLQILGTHGHTCNRLLLPSNNSSDDVELPVPVKNGRLMEHKGRVLDHFTEE